MPADPLQVCGEVPAGTHRHHIVGDAVQQRERGAARPVSGSGTMNAPARQKVCRGATPNRSACRVTPAAAGQLQSAPRFANWVDRRFNASLRPGLVS
ncbi:hypothetical protein MAHJHV63_55490 [Mycobacterium avium subsp. hominissuis]